MPRGSTGQEYAQVDAVQDRQGPRNHLVVVLFIKAVETYWFANEICLVLLLILGIPEVKINISCNSNTFRWYNTRSDRGCVIE
jgi:hypothetical protein